MFGKKMAIALAVAISAALTIAPTSAFAASSSQSLSVDGTRIKAMLDSGRLTASGVELQQLRGYATGNPVKRTRGGVTRTCTINSAIVTALYDVVMNKKMSLNVTSLNRYCEFEEQFASYSLHWKNGGGHAIDVDRVNNATVGANPAAARSYITAMIAKLGGSGAIGYNYGSPCAQHQVKLPKGWGTVPDTCSHVHIEYHGGSAPSLLPVHSDYDGDGRDDILGTNSTLRAYLNYGGWFRENKRGSGWGTTKTLLPGDYNGDGKSDFMAIRTDGTLWQYSRTASLKFTATQRGSGWNTYSEPMVSGGVDYNNDRKADLIALDSAGKLWLYAGNGSGGFAARKAIATGMKGMSRIIAGDFTGDGKGDLMLTSAGGKLLFMKGNGKGFGSRTTIGSGWNSSLDVFGGGDYNVDGKADVVARTATGDLLLYPGTGAGAVSTSVKIGHGWNSFMAVG